jgi:AraC-like DNA-binding protein/DNA gyrase inhibitor GyrI
MNNKSQHQKLDQLYFSLRANVVDYQEHINKALEQTGLGLSQLNRVFKKIYGETFLACLRRTALQEAAHQLKHTTLSILDIALNANYSGAGSFSHAFKKYFGSSPIKFRRDSHRTNNIFKIDGSKIKLQRIQNQNFIGLRHKGDYQMLQDAFVQLMQEAKLLFNINTLQVRPLVAYVDDPTISGCINNRAVIGFHSRDQDLKLSVQGDFEEFIWPGGDFLIYDYYGPYADINRAMLDANLHTI